MSLANDIVAVKKAVENNWEDILQTADQLEHMISSGIAWLEEDANIKTVKDAIAGIQLPDTDISKLTAMLQENEAAIAAELDPILLELQSLLAEDEPDIEAIISFIETTIKGFNFVTLPEWNGVSLDALKNILIAIANSGFSVSTVDLPFTKNTANTTQSNVPNTPNIAPANTQPTQPDTATVNGNTNTPSDSSSTNTQPAFTDAQDGLLAGLEQHFMDTIAKYETDIETLLGSFDQLVSDATITDLETKFQQIQTNLSQQQTLNTSFLIQQLNILTSDPIFSSGTLLPSALSTLSNSIDKLTQIFSDLLSSQTLNDNDSLCKLYNEIRGVSGQVTPLKLLCLSLAIPVTITSFGILGQAQNIVETAFQQETNSADNKTFGIADIVQVAPELSKIVFNIYEYNEMPVRVYGKKKYVPYIADLGSLILEIVGIAASKPHENSDFTAVPITNSVWSIKLILRPIKMIYKLYLDIQLKRDQKNKIENNNKAEEPMFVIPKELNRVVTKPLIQPFKEIQAKYIELINLYNRVEDKGLIPNTLDNFLTKLNKTITTKIDIVVIFSPGNISTLEKRYEIAQSLIIPDIISYPTTFNPSQNTLYKQVQKMVSNGDYKRFKDVADQFINDYITNTKEINNSVDALTKNILDKYYNRIKIISWIGLFGELGIGAWYTINYNVKNYTKNYELIGSATCDVGPSFWSNLTDLWKSYNHFLAAKSELKIGDKTFILVEVLNHILNLAGKVAGGIISLKRPSIIITRVDYLNATLTITFSDVVRNNNNDAISTTDCFFITTLTPSKTPPQIILAQSSADQRTINLTFRGGERGTYAIKPVYLNVFDQYGFPVSTKQDNNTFTLLGIENVTVNGTNITVKFDSAIIANTNKSIGENSFVVFSNDANKTPQQISTVTSPASNEVNKTTFIITMKQALAAGSYLISPGKDALKFSTSGSVLSNNSSYSLIFPGILNTAISGNTITLTFNTLIQSNKQGVSAIDSSFFNIQSTTTPANRINTFNVSQNDSTGQSVFTITLNNNPSPQSGTYMISPIADLLKNGNNIIVATDQANNTFTIS
jgi:hypothetical protein